MLRVSLFIAYIKVTAMQFAVLYCKIKDLCEELIGYKKFGALVWLAILLVINTVINLLYMVTILPIMFICSTVAILVAPRWVEGNMEAYI